MDLTTRYLGLTLRNRWSPRRSVVADRPRIVPRRRGVGAAVLYPL